MVTTRGFSLLLVASTALFGVGPTSADYSDCRTCHYATSIGSTAPDFTGYFVAAGHHPVRVGYPVVPDYNQPAGATTGILFFDLNGNGVPDPDEIQLFSSTASGNTWMIDCASCHIEHGLTPPDPLHVPDYVRRAGSAPLLCITCHKL